MVELALKKGEEKFKTIVLELNKINALLIRLDERLALWIEKDKQ